MKRILSVLITVVALAGSIPCANADEPTDNPYVWKPRVTAVTVFKNGLGFFLREGTVSLRDGWCYSAAVPPASFGTLALYSH
ncbi:MAG: hypothetical protein FJ224_12730, partial [Lentisphaerae bacterium]|nr:hypothetical protein [Lentisphaerota bacterium]